ADSGAIAAFGEAEQHLAGLRQAVASEGLDAVQHLWQLTDGGLDELRTGGAQISDDEVERRRSGMGLRDLATIIY
ncbi:hypothetical protein, partial [Enterobacter hormaechei]